MIAVVRVALLTVLATASIPAVAPAQGAAIDSLNRRVILLERQVALLEQRVGMLETLVKAQSSQDGPVPATTNPGALANWRRLSRGMTMNAVRGLLGEPQGVAAFASATHWQYPDAGGVDFGSDNKVEGWMEPPRSAVGGTDPVTGEIYLEAQLDDPPAPISVGPQRYPAVLERAGIGGRVVAQFVVDTSGHPEAAGFKVLSTTNPAFNDPAREMIMTSVFRPGRLRGQAVRVQVQQTVSFNP